MIDGRSVYTPLFSGAFRDVMPDDIDRIEVIGGPGGTLWGANYRYGMDWVDDTNPYFAFLPANANQTWASLFTRDEMALVQDVRLTGGLTCKTRATRSRPMPGKIVNCVLAIAVIHRQDIRARSRVPNSLDIGNPA